MPHTHGFEVSGIRCKIRSQIRHKILLVPTTFFSWLLLGHVSRRALSACSCLAQTVFFFILQVGNRSPSHIKVFCFSVNHTILLCSSALVCTAATSLTPPLTQGVSNPFRKTIIPDSPVPPAHSPPCFCAFLKCVKFVFTVKNRTGERKSEACRSC